MEGPALEVDGRRIDAAHYLVATGSVPHVPAIAGLRDSGYLTSTTAMELDHRPASMIVVGGGYVALEQAQLFAHLGTSVTMLVRSQLARREEPEIAAGIRDAFGAEGIAVVEGVEVTRVQSDAGQVVVMTDRGEFGAEELLVATGRRPRADGVALAAVGVALGARPTIASAGMTEAQAQAHAQGIDCECRVLDLANVPRAIVSRHTRGVAKLVADRASGRVLGIHLLADGAGDAVLAAVYAIEARRTVSELADGWDPYLTIGEAIHLAALAFTRDPRKLSCCAA